MNGKLIRFIDMSINQEILIGKLAATINERNGKRSCQGTWEGIARKNFRARQINFF